MSSPKKKISALLSRWPWVHSKSQHLWHVINYAIHKKGFRYKIYGNHTIALVDLPGENTFFGYYDKTPIHPSKSDLLVFHKTKYPAHRKPNSGSPVDICLFSLPEKRYTRLDQSFSWNWQQGARLHWLNEKEIIYNVYDAREDRYLARILDISNTITRDFPFPIYDTYSANYGLGLNFDRLALLRPDYGYRNRLHALKSIKPWDADDGIWYIDFNTHNHRLIISLEELFAFFPRPSMQKAWHKVNHVMISPDGKQFVFLHRWISNRKKFDRLILFDLVKNTMQLLLDDDMVSHYCWIDNDNILLYGRHDNIDDYYILTLDDVRLSPLLNRELRLFGDGHPSVCRKNKNIVVTDTYPDVSRVRKLMIINWKHNKVFILGEFLEPLRYENETRGDLHPNFGSDGSTIHLDTVFLDKRCLAVIHLSDNVED